MQFFFKVQCQCIWNNMV